VLDRDTSELEKMLARANEYTDGISREVDRRLDKMDKRFNRMAAMTTAQSAMAMNTPASTPTTASARAWATARVNRPWPWVTSAC